MLFIKNVLLFHPPPSLIWQAKPTFLTDFGNRASVTADVQTSFTNLMNAEAREAV